MNLTPEQLTVQRACLAHLSSRSPTPLTLGGYAGTGKTTILSTLQEALPHLSLGFLTPTGKAAEVQRRKGIPAQTIHSTIYDYIRLEDGTFSSTLRKELPFDALVCDEASMISSTLDRDLRSFNLPILYVGDHGQLEPVDSSGFNLMASPRLRLETIHRQALDSPITRLAHHVRTGNPPSSFSHDSLSDSRLTLHTGSLPPSILTGSSQVICGYNKTRVSLNSMIRQSLGHTSLLVPSERVIILRNNQEHGVFNGMCGTILSPSPLNPRSAYTTVSFLPDGSTTPLSLPIYVPTISTGEIPQKLPSTPSPLTFRDICFLTYSYALTCHKSQGSEWPSVSVISEPSSLWSHSRWLYTAITRASSTLTLHH